jgi:2-C-methyl-D-erythritol 2,4-cyclodiphosphate synthase
MRIGSGYDVHRLVPGRKLIIGGVDIPYEKGLEGHSDADVLLHAVTDALLGALALGDIGVHFPDTAPEWNGADSLIFLRGANKLIAEKGFAVENVDATIIAEAPKMLPHIPLMRENIAAALGVEKDKISVKATTNEKMGWIGRGEGIAAMAAVLLTEARQKNA